MSGDWLAGRRDESNGTTSFIIQQPDHRVIRSSNRSQEKAACNMSAFLQVSTCCHILCCPLSSQATRPSLESMSGCRQRVQKQEVMTNLEVITASAHQKRKLLFKGYLVPTQLSCADKPVSVIIYPNPWQRLFKSYTESFHPGVKHLRNTLVLFLG